MNYANTYAAEKDKSGIIQIEAVFQFPPLCYDKWVLDLISPYSWWLTQKYSNVIETMLLNKAVEDAGMAGLFLSFDRDIPFWIKIGENRYQDIKNIHILVSPRSSRYNGTGVALVTFKEPSMISDKDKCKLYLTEYNVQSEKKKTGTPLFSFAFARGTVTHTYGRVTMDENEFCQRYNEIYKMVQNRINNWQTGCEEMRQYVCSLEELEKHKKLNDEIARTAVNMLNAYWEIEKKIEVNLLHLCGPERPVHRSFPDL